MLILSTVMYHSVVTFSRERESWRIVVMKGEKKEDVFLNVGRPTAKLGSDYPPHLLSEFEFFLTPVPKIYLEIPSMHFF
jgi:hypothetical protein